MMIAMRMDIRHERTESGADATAEERLTMMIDHCFPLDITEIRHGVVWTTAPSFSTSAAVDRTHGRSDIADSGSVIANRATSQQPGKSVFYAQCGAFHGKGSVFF